MGSQHGDRSLWFVLGWLAILLFAWNALSQRFDASRTALRETGPVLDRAARNLGITLAELPPPALPRVAIYGSSQIAVVKRAEEDSLASLPHRLAPALAERGARVEVVDFSDGGQQLVESMVVHFATREVTRPSAMVVGVSLFAMTRVDVRETLFEDVDGHVVAAAIRDALPPDADPASREALLAWTKALAPPAPDREPTVQERCDRAIGGWLERNVAAYANRQAIYRYVVDGPARREIQRLRREHARTKTSSSYAIGPAYEPSLLALEVMRRSAAARGIPFLVVLLPFDHARPPVPFDPPTQARVAADVGAIAARAGVPVLDLGDALASGHFGDYEDGSPDNLHFDAGGHERVAQRIAERLAPLLAGSR